MKLADALSNLNCLKEQLCVLKLKYNQNANDDVLDQIYSLQEEIVDLRLKICKTNSTVGCQKEMLCLEMIDYNIRMFKNMDSTKDQGDISNNLIEEIERKHELKKIISKFNEVTEIVN